MMRLVRTSADSSGWRGGGGGHIRLSTMTADGLEGAASARDCLSISSTSSPAQNYIGRSEHQDGPETVKSISSRSYNTAEIF